MRTLRTTSLALVRPLLPLLPLAAASWLPACSTPPAPPPVVAPAPEPSAVAPAPSPPAAPAAPEAAPADAPYRDPARPLDERVKDLVGRMTLEEKVSQLMDNAAAIDRLGVPAYNWWNEALHGVARAGVATVFPQAIGLAAAWDEDLMFRVATVTSDEARAKYHQFQREGKRGRYQGLTFFSPNINIFRDPRWGRGHETYGEDPHLTGRLGVAFIKGLQGDHPKYLKTVATAKHYAVHSGPEHERHSFDARVSKRELWDTYLPHFELAIREGKAESVMSAYNAVDGVPASASEDLLERILRKTWGFNGYVVTDCGAINDIFKHHKYKKTAEEASAVALKNGTDLECGRAFKALTGAVQQGLISEAELDRPLHRLFRARFRLGMFDPPDMVPWAQIPYEKNDAPEHRALALEAARKSIVLLENRNGTLPLRDGIKTLAVIGPTADDVDVLLGNYNGTPSRHTTILAGIKQHAAERGAQVIHAKGSEIVGDAEDKIPQAVDAAKKADAVVLVLGLSPREEGEEGESKANPSGDRKEIGLFPAQDKLLRAVVAAAGRKPVVLVLTGGSALAVPYAKEKVPAILMSWYSGEEGGLAVADVLFGKANPGGRLPLTFYASEKDLPDFRDYGMKNRTYRYFTGQPLWAFGHGRSYSTFRYSGIGLSAAPLGAGQTGAVTVQVRNTSKRDGDEVVQVYVTDQKASVPVPLRTLVAWKRVSLKAGESKTLTFPLTPRALSIVDEEGRRIVEPGRFTIAVGGGQPGKGNRYASPAEGQTVELEVTGQVFALK